MTVQLFWSFGRLGHSFTKKTTDIFEDTCWLHTNVLLLSKIFLNTENVDQDFDGRNVGGSLGKNWIWMTKNMTSWLFSINQRKKTKGAVALRYFPSKGQRNDLLNIQQTDSENEPIFQKRKLSVETLMEEFKPVVLEEIDSSKINWITLLLDLFCIFGLSRFQSTKQKQRLFSQGVI